MSELQREFDAFDAQNPSVWELFVRFASEAISAGHIHLSASLIVERIRWETQVATRSKDDLKINNNHRAYYARKFNGSFPWAGGKFLTRTVGAEGESSVPFKLESE